MTKNPTREGQNPRVAIVGQINRVKNWGTHFRSAGVPNRLIGTNPAPQELKGYDYIVICGQTARVSAVKGKILLLAEQRPPLTLLCETPQNWHSAIVQIKSETRDRVNAKLASNQTPENTLETPVLPQPPQKIPPQPLLPAQSAPPAPQPLLPAQSTSPAPQPPAPRPPSPKIHFRSASVFARCVFNNFGVISSRFFLDARVWEKGERAAIDFWTSTYRDFVPDQSEDKLSLWIALWEYAFNQSRRPHGKALYSNTCLRLDQVHADSAGVPLHLYEIAVSEGCCSGVKSRTVRGRLLSIHPVEKGIIKHFGDIRSKKFVYPAKKDSQNGPSYDGTSVTEINVPLTSSESPTPSVVTSPAIPAPADAPPGDLAALVGLVREEMRKLGLRTLHVQPTSVVIERVVIQTETIEGL